MNTISKKFLNILNQLDPPIRKRKATNLDVLTIIIDILKSGGELPWNA
jgi:hypothetical protein